MTKKSPLKISFLAAVAKTVPLLVILGMLILGLLITPTTLPAHTLCMFKQLFGIDCPGCGLTRAFLLIPRGHWHEALTLNFASLALYGFFILILVMLLGQLFKKNFMDSDRWKKIRLALAFLVIVMLLGQWVVKIFASLIAL